MEKETKKKGISWWWILVVIFLMLFLINDPMEEYEGCIDKCVRESKCSSREKFDLDGGSDYYVPSSCYRDLKDCVRVCD